MQDRLECELADLLAAIDFVLEANPHLNRQSIVLQREVKLARFREWHVGKTVDEPIAAVPLVRCPVLDFTANTRCRLREGHRARMGIACLFVPKGRLCADRVDIGMDPNVERVTCVRAKQHEGSHMDWLGYRWIT